MVKVGLIDDAALVAVGDGQLRVDVLSVGNADAILIRQGENAMLIDGGSARNAGNILDFLRYADVERLDYVIASHFDADHIGGLGRIVSQIETEVFLYADMQGEPTDLTSASLFDELQEQDVTTQTVKTGDVYRLGLATVRILGPSRSHDNDNDGSVICRVEMGERSFLFMGDAELAAEQDAMLSPCKDYLPSDVLKVGHHGADTSTNIHFLNRVDPRYAVISCQEGNMYGHPHKALLERLSGSGTTYYRTDLCGRVSFLTDGHTITVQTER